jgi:hypothetical protein
MTEEQLETWCRELALPRRESREFESIAGDGRCGVGYTSQQIRRPLGSLRGPTASRTRAANALATRMDGVAPAVG